MIYSYSNPDVFQVLETGQFLVLEDNKIIKKNKTGLSILSGKYLSLESWRYGLIAWQCPTPNQYMSFKGLMSIYDIRFL